jgi:hypothetical protein
VTTFVERRLQSASLLTARTYRGRRSSYHRRLVVGDRKMVLVCDGFFDPGDVIVYRGPERRADALQRGRRAGDQ